MSLTIDLSQELTEGQVVLQSPRLSHNEFARFCERNPEVKAELSAAGELILMAPTGGETGNRNAKLARFLDEWTETNGTGVAFDSSTMFVLPSGAERSPDSAWVRRDRWDALTPDEREAFVPLCPDFVIELMSRTDRLRDARAKMDEWIANGVRLAWLIDRRNRRVYVYRPGTLTEEQDNPAELSGDPELPGFVLRMDRIF